MQGPAWESERSLPEIPRPFVRLSAVVCHIALQQLKALNKSEPFQVTKAFQTLGLLCQFIISNIRGMLPE